ncbi:MAG: DUF4177 domain-containing protein [Acidimicrobiales bacterium]
MATTFTRWEYRTYSVFMEQGTRSWLVGLNELGDDGWEVTDDITLFVQGGTAESVILLLKRPKIA